MINEILGHGKENARTAAELCRALNLDRRAFSAAVEHERRKGFPICASRAGVKGYYLADSREEMEEYCKILGATEKSIHKTKRACLKAAEKLPETA